MQSIKQYKGLPKEIYVLFIATIVNRMGDFIFPFLTLFLKSKIGLNASQIGNVLVWSTVLYILATAVGGKLADHFNRKKVYIYCTVMSIVMMSICSVMAQGYAMVGILIISQVFLRIATPAMDAMKMDLTNRTNRQVSFSLIYLGINIGVAIGPMIAGILFAEHIRILFVGDVLTSIIALSLIGFYVKGERKWFDDDNGKQDETKVNEPAVLDTLEQAEEGSLWQVLLKRPNLLIFCGICSILAFIYAQGNFMLPLHLEAIYKGNDGSRYYGYLIAINAIIVVITTPYIVEWTKKNHSLTNIMLGAICYILGFGMYGVLEDKCGFIIGTCIWSLGEILYTTNSGVYMANHAPISHRGRFQSVYIIVLYIGKTLAPMIMGQYLMGHRFAQGWHIIALVGVVAVGMIVASRQFEKQPGEVVSP